LALAATPIVVLNERLFNRLALDVSVCPLVQFDAIKADALFADREFAHVGSHGFIEFGSTHAEIPVCIARPDKPRHDLRHPGGGIVSHSKASPGRTGQIKKIGFGSGMLGGGMGQAATASSKLMIQRHMLLLSSSWPSGLTS